MKRKLILCTMLILVLLTLAVPTFATENEISVDSQGAVAMDTKTGKIIYEKNANKQLAPASLTKIMTCIILLEKLDMNDTVVIPAEATGSVVGGQNMALVEGEEFTVEQLINCMMVYSANDAAVALAIKASGSVSEFTKEMTAKAKKLGAKHTNFISPNGLTNSTEHTTTAKDMAIITIEALKNKTFRDIVKQVKYEVPPTNKSERRLLKSTNKLLYDKKSKINVDGEIRTPKYDGAFGVKTGTMDSAGYCLVAGARKDNTEIVTVVLKNSDDLDRFADSIEMLDYGLNNFYTFELMKPNEDCGQVKVKYGHETRVEAIAANGAYITLPTEGSESVADTKVVFYEHVKAPIKKGTKVGNIEIYEGNEKVSTEDIVIAKSVKKGGPWAAIYISDLMATIILVSIAIIVIAILIIKRKQKVRARRYELKRKREQEAKRKQIEMEQSERRRRGWPY